MKTRLIFEALGASFKKLNPFTLWRNPIMFIVEIGSVLTTYFLIRNFFLVSHIEFIFILQITIWLWFTVLFANFAEAIAEGRGKAQAMALRKTRKEIIARKIQDGKIIEVISSTLKKDDMVMVSAGEIIPGDGEIIEGIASVDESVVTGESAPVIRESGGDRSSVIGGTKVLSDEIKVRITANPGDTFLDKMISMVESAKRQKTPNEIALTILLLGLTIIFILVVVYITAFCHLFKYQCFNTYPGFPACLFDPDYHRRAAKCYRNSWHEQANKKKCYCPFRKSCRSCRRC